MQLPFHRPPPPDPTKFSLTLGVVWTPIALIGLALWRVAVVGPFDSRSALIALGLVWGSLAPLVVSAVALALRIALGPKG